MVSADATVRTWRSVFAWLPISRPRAVQRAVWTVVLACTTLASVGLVAYLVVG
jgi:hypothetical protein